jgi:xylulose-5-phosphate/fructose-6-phosphate phosphoketolase
MADQRLLTLQPKSPHPDGISEADFDALFTTSAPVIFAYHGYPSLIRRLVWKRRNHDNFHVRGFMEEGTTTTPFGMVGRNRLDRFHLIADAIDRIPGLSDRGVYVRQAMRDTLIDHERYIVRHGKDMPEVADWRRPAAPAHEAPRSTAIFGLYRRTGIALKGRHRSSNDGWCHEGLMP